MKKTKLLALLLLICALLSALAPSALALEQPSVGSRFVVLADAETGQVYYEKNADDMAYPASLTKIMTVLLAVEAVNAGTVSPDDLVTASADCAQGLTEDSSTSGIVAGETMSLENLMYCAMVESANEACNIIGERLSGSIAAFVERMNQRAAELGCQGTHFVNPHGMPDADHYTTARDMLLITEKALSYELFRKICGTVKYTVPATNMAPARELSNTNGLINADSKLYPGYYFEYATGVKTGHTNDAGYCLVSAAAKDDVSLIAVVMGGAAIDRGDGVYTYGCFTDSVTLYKWIFNNFSRQDLVSSSELVAEVPVELGADSDTVTLRPARVISALVPNDVDVSAYERTVTIYSQEKGEALRAPVEAGAELGEIVVSRDGVVYGSCKLVASTGVELARWQYFKQQLKNAAGVTWVKVILWVLILALLGYGALVIRYRVLHRRHLQEQRRRAQEREKRVRHEEELSRTFRDVPADGRQSREEFNSQRGDYFDDYFGSDRHDDQW